MTQKCIIWDLETLNHDTKKLTNVLTAVDQH